MNDWDLERTDDAPEPKQPRTEIDPFDAYDEALDRAYDKPPHLRTVRDWALVLGIRMNKKEVV